MNIGKIAVGAAIAGVISVAAVGVVGAEPKLSGRPIPADSAFSPDAQAPGGSDSFGVNDQGQTFGSMLDATNESGAPDLIAVWATNGQLGYVYSEDFQRPVPEGTGDITLPVFNSDGLTKIGEFVLQAGDAK